MNSKAEEVSNMQQHEAATYAGYSKYHWCPIHKQSITINDIFHINLAAISPCNKCKYQDRCNNSITQQQKNINTFRKEIFALIFSTPPMHDSTRISTSRIEYHLPKDELENVKICYFKLENKTQWDKWLQFDHLNNSTPKVITPRRDTSKYDNCTESITISIEEIKPLKKVKDKSKYARCTQSIKMTIK
jgi:hypothetical protein